MYLLSKGSYTGNREKGKRGKGNSEQGKGNREPGTSNKQPATRNRPVNRQKFLKSRRLQDYLTIFIN
jgi:hypothetical protein